MEEINKDSQVLREIPEVYSLFQTYRYRIEFESYYSKRGMYEFYYNSELKYSPLPIIEFESIDKLSLKEIYKLFIGTDGIKSIKGEFKKD